MRIKRKRNRQRAASSISSTWLFRVVLVLVSFLVMLQMLAVLVSKKEEKSRSKHNVVETSLSVGKEESSKSSSPYYTNNGNTITAADLHLTVVDPSTLEKKKFENKTWIQNAIQEREPILKLLLEAGIQNIDMATLDQLPTWDHVVDLYGGQPAFVGLEQCDAYRQRVVHKSNVTLSIAGMFNSGTNVLFSYLMGNCRFRGPHGEEYTTSDSVRWQVPWGKHSLELLRGRNVVAGEAHLNTNNILPIVIARDPYTWMQSMCRHSYSVEWHHSTKHCPNLVPNHHDYRIYKFSGQNIPVRVKAWKQFNLTKDHHHSAPMWKSLAHFWHDWYNQYYTTTTTTKNYPRIMIRLEDLVFHPKTTTKTICECAGGTLEDEEDFFYPRSSAKVGQGHGRDKTGLVEALIAHGKSWHRLQGYTVQDLELAHHALGDELMQALQYKKAVPNESLIP